MNTKITPVPGEQVTEKDGLIHGISAVELQTLCQTAIEAKATAYCKYPAWCYIHPAKRDVRPGPYSLFRVGASILLKPSAPHSTSLHVITGANVENASYPVGTCAERVAMGTAVVSGYKMGSFKAVGVATDMDDFCSPCGMCRQFLREFLELEIPVFMFTKEGKFVVRTMGELLPLSFGPDKLPPREELRKGLEQQSD